MSYPIVSQIENLADAFGKRAPKKGYEILLEKLFDELKISDVGKDMVFHLAQSESTFPTIGTMRSLCLRVNAGAAKHAKVKADTHILMRCPICDMGYAIEIVRLSAPMEGDVLVCEGHRRVAVDSINADQTNYRYEKCSAAYSMQTLASYWALQSEGSSFTIPKV